MRYLKRTFARMLARGQREVARRKQAFIEEGWKVTKTAYRELYERTGVSLVEGRSRGMEQGRLWKQHVRILSPYMGQWRLMLMLKPYQLRYAETFARGRKSEGLEAEWAGIVRRKVKQW